MISQFFVVSMRGDSILHKECKTISFIIHSFSSYGLEYWQVYYNTRAVSNKSGNHKFLLGGKSHSLPSILCKN